MGTGGVSVPELETRQPTAYELIQLVVKASGETQARWSARLGYTPRTFNLIYHGQQPVSAEFAVKIERATKGRVTARELLHLQADASLRDYFERERWQQRKRSR